jgi:predicted RNase H-like HicB family nuclease
VPVDFRRTPENITPKRYAVIIEATSTGFSAYSPDVPGCAAVGDSLEEARRNLREALEFHFEGRRLAGEPIPEPSSTVDYIEIAARPSNTHLASLLDELGVHEEHMGDSAAE